MLVGESVCGDVSRGADMAPSSAISGRLRALAGNSSSLKSNGT
jgi:hypothetical protein